MGHDDGALGRLHARPRLRRFSKHTFRSQAATSGLEARTQGNNGVAGNEQDKGLWATLWLMS